MRAYHPDAPAHLIAFLARHRIEATFVAPGIPMPTVPFAARAIGVPEEEILKTLVFAADDDSFVVAIANGTRRIDRTLLGRAANVLRPRAAAPTDVLRVTGFAAGGVAPLGLPGQITVVVDEAAAALTLAYGGGGREHLLLHVRMADVLHFNQAIVAAIVDRSALAPN